MKNKGGAVLEVNPKLIRIASDVIRDSPRETTTECLVDAFQCACRYAQINDVNRKTALAALAKSQEGRST